MMRQALKDKERQIALLTAEVERLQGRPVSKHQNLVLFVVYKQ